MLISERMGWIARESGVRYPQLMLVVEPFCLLGVAGEKVVRRHFEYVGTSVEIFSLGMSLHGERHSIYVNQGKLESATPEAH